MSDQEKGRSHTCRSGATIFRRRSPSRYPTPLGEVIFQQDSRGLQDRSQELKVSAPNTESENELRMPKPNYILPSMAGER